MAALLYVGPDGRVLYEAGGNEEIFPLELNIERVRRSREMGVLRLGQPLKSFRDHIGDFKVYDEGADLSYLESLGPLIKPKRVDRLAELKQKEYELKPHASSQYRKTISGLMAKYFFHHALHIVHHSIESAIGQQEHFHLI